MTSLIAFRLHNGQECSLFNYCFKKMADSSFLAYGEDELPDSASNLSEPTSVSRSFLLDPFSSTANTDDELTIKSGLKSLKEPLQKLTNEWEQVKKKYDEMLHWITNKWKMAEDEKKKMEEEKKKLEEEKRQLEWELAEKQLAVEELQMKLDDAITGTAVSSCGDMPRNIL